jgi:hypothetical protein
VPNYYPISPYGHPYQNPHFGALSPNGLNLGLISVNPLVSLQVTKSEHGGKLVKPFVNLHVTPNKGIIDTIGGLFYAKKNVLHKHLHLHRYPPRPDFLPHPPHHLPPPIEGPILPYPPQPYHNLPPPIEGPILPYPPPSNFHNHHHLPPPIEGPFSPYPPNHEESFYPPGPIGFRSSNKDVSNDNSYNYQSVYNTNENAPINNNYVNGAKDDYRYARQYSNADESNKNFVQSIPAQAPGSNEGSESISFPSSRRRRDTDQVVPSSLEEKSSKDDEDDAETAGRAYGGVKVDLDEYFHYHKSLKNVF